MRLNSLIAAAALLASAALAVPAAAQEGPDPVLAAARASGIIGEQRDGYVGVVDAARVTPDIRARVQSLNTRRRAAFTRRATPPATVDEMATAFACEVYASRISAGEYFQGASGWQRSSGGAAPAPSPTCSN